MNKTPNPLRKSKRKDGKGCRPSLSPTESSVRIELTVTESDAYNISAAALCRSITRQEYIRRCIKMDLNAEALTEEE